MFIFRAILNNGFIIALISIAALIYIATSDQIKRDHHLTQKVSNKSDHNDTHLSSEPPEHNVTGKVVPKKPMQSKTVSKVMTSPQTDVNVSALPSSKPMLKIHNQTQQHEKNIQPFEITDKDVMPSKTVSGKPQLTSASEQLAAARAAVAQNNIVLAQKLYVSLMEHHPTANLFGEVGNLLYVHGRLDLATQAWMQAGDFLIKEGRIQEASALGQRLMQISPKASKYIWQALQPFAKSNAPHS